MGEKTKITIEPKKTFSFPVTFRSRISKTVRGKIIFANHRSIGTQSAAVIVFELESEIKGRIPNMIKDILQTPLYKQCEYELNIHNPWPKDGIFNIEISTKD